MYKTEEEEEKTVHMKQCCIATLIVSVRKIATVPQESSFYLTQTTRKDEGEGKREGCKMIKVVS